MNKNVLTLVVTAIAEPSTFKMLFLREKVNGEWMSQGEMYVVGEFDTGK